MCEIFVTIKSMVSMCGDCIIVRLERLAISIFNVSLTTGVHLNISTKNYLVTRYSLISSSAFWFLGAPLSVRAGSPVVGYDLNGLADVPSNPRFFTDFHVIFTLWNLKTTVVTLPRSHGRLLAFLSP